MLLTVAERVAENSDPLHSGGPASFEGAAQGTLPLLLTSLSDPYSVMEWSCCLH